MTEVITAKKKKGWWIIITIIILFLFSARLLSLYCFFIYFLLQHCDAPAVINLSTISWKKTTMRKTSRVTIRTIISTSKHFVFLRKWLLANCWLLSDVCNNLRAFLLSVSMTTPWHAWRLWKREGDKHCLFHCAKMPPLPSTAILSQAYVTELQRSSIIPNRLTAAERLLEQQSFIWSSWITFHRALLKMNYLWSLNQYRYHWWCQHLKCLNLKKVFSVSSVCLGGSP